MKLHHFAICFLLGSATIAFAQPATPPARGPGHGGPRGPGRGPGHAIVRALDTDKDGTLSATELASAPTALKALDTNGDGTISLDELRPARPANAPTPPAGAPSRPATVPAGDHPRPADPIMLALDANEDRSLDAGEIGRATASLQALDLNKDGQLTPDEYRPLPPARPANE